MSAGWKRYIIFWILVLLQAIGIKSQIILPYKSSVPSEVFNLFYQKEKSLKDTISAESGQVYLELGREALSHNEDLAIAYEQKAKQIFSKTGMDSLTAVTNLSLSLPYINKGMYDEADTAIRDVLSFSQRTKNAKLTADAHLRLGYQESARGKPDKALAAYLTCYQFYRDKKQNHEYGDIIMRLGLTYAAIGDCGTALRYWEDYIRAAETKKANDRFVIPVKSNMMDCYTKTGNIPSAREMARDVINARKKSNSFKQLCKVYLKLSFLSSSEKKPDEALSYMDTAYQYAVRFGNDRLLSDVLLARAGIYREKGTEKRAVQDLHDALIKARLSQTPSNQISACHTLADIYQHNLDFKKAFYYDQMGDSIKDAVFSSDVIYSIKALEKQMVLQNSEEKIAMLETQNKLKSENIIQQKKVHEANVILLILSGLLLSLLTWLIIIRTRNNTILSQKNKEIEKSLVINKMLVKEMHHRVKNNLQIVASLLGLQSRFAKDKNVYEAVTEGKTRVQTMSLLHQSLYKNEDLKEIPIKKYFQDLCENLASTFSLSEQNITLQADIKDINLDLDKVVTLGMIVNECIINSIKHAFVNRKQGAIHLNIKEEKNEVVCIIKDNGTGIPFQNIPEKSASMGMQLISSFITKLEGNISLQKDSGTIITISFKNENIDA
jgi:two-component sensor histidine kinase/predicted negative regulator of RcsB-dependent stress response